MAKDWKRVLPDGPDGDHDGQFSVLVDQLLGGVFGQFFFEFHLWRVLVASQAVYTQLAPILVAILDELQDQKDHQKCNLYWLLCEILSLAARFVLRF